uniref:Uncharacterized protein n=1 Tax=Arundo donax TaxID=35708 RepID=A0A0A9DWB2_ARUDO
MCFLIQSMARLFIHSWEQNRLWEQLSWSSSSTEHPPPPLVAQPQQPTSAPTGRSCSRCAP